MKKTMFIVLVALCLAGCISISRGQDLELERINKSHKDTRSAQKEVESAIHKSEGENIIYIERISWVDPNIPGDYYVRKKDTYYCTWIELYDFYPLSNYPDIHISLEQWKQLPSEKKKKFKKW